MTPSPSLRCGTAPKGCYRAWTGLLGCAPFAARHPGLPMQIAVNCVAHIHYTLKDDAGAVIDSSSGGEPLAYLHGAGNIVPGLEKALEGKQAGEKLSVKVAPEEGYGVRDEALVQQVPRRSFQGVKDLKAGMRYHATNAQGPVAMTVTRVARDEHYSH